MNRSGSTAQTCSAKRSSVDLHKHVLVDLFAQRDDLTKGSVHLHARDRHRPVGEMVLDDDVATRNHADRVEEGKRGAIGLNLLRDARETYVRAVRYLADRELIAKFTAHSRNQAAVWTRRRMSEHGDEARLDIIGDDVLPTTGLFVRLVPGETDNIDEKTLCEAMSTHDAQRALHALVRERDASTRAGQVSVVTETVHHLRDRLGREAETFDKSCLDDGDALFGEAVDGLEVLLDWGMETVRHAISLPVDLSSLSMGIAPELGAISKE